MKEKRKAFAPDSERERKENGLPVPLAAVTLSRRNALSALKKGDWKKLCLAAGGITAAVSTVHLLGRYQFYRGIVAGEVKKQLTVVNNKLDILHDQNESIRAELSQLRREREDDGTAKE